MVSRSFSNLLNLSLIFFSPASTSFLLIHELLAVLVLIKGSTNGWMNTSVLSGSKDRHPYSGVSSLIQLPDNH